nr:hypothetical protein Clen_71 [Cedratvirus lena]
MRTIGAKKEPLFLSCSSSKVGHESDWCQTCFLVKLYTTIMVYDGKINGNI